jgi:hypothetical protein
MVGSLVVRMNCQGSCGIYFDFIEKHPIIILFQRSPTLFLFPFFGVESGRAVMEEEGGQVGGCLLVYRMLYPDFLAKLSTA